jgi:Protein of unknown function (DUF3500)
MGETPAPLRYKKAIFYLPSKVNSSVISGMTNSPFVRFGAIIVIASALFTFSARAHSPGEEMADAANHFLAALTPEQKAKATFDLKDAERSNWNFVPLIRKGLTFKEMTPGQHLLGQALLNSALSQRGYMKAVTIMSLDDILKEMEQGSGPVRDPELYYVSIFGKPDAAGTWGWRIEGHHLSLNFVIVGGTNTTVTPSFFGSNPAEVRTGARTGLRVLGTEEDLGRQLVKSLNDGQKKIAIYTNTAPNEIITGNQRKASLLTPTGLVASKMDKAQQALLRQVIEEYVRRYRPELADVDLQKIEKVGWEKIFFAWAGGVEPGQGHYYRVQGPTFLMEFDNTQNNANHIHAVWRDLANDFGEDLLRQHYDAVPHQN